MNAITLLMLILFVLMALIGGKRGIQSFLSLFVNVVILFLVIKAIASGYHPLIMTFIGSMVITIFTLFIINGIHKKTIATFISVNLVVLMTLVIVTPFSLKAKIGGFGEEELEALSGLNLDVAVHFPTIMICAILFSLLGAVMDISISMSSAMNELVQQNSQISAKKCRQSGMKIGIDILGTMVNTLLFAYMSGFMSLILYFQLIHLSFVQIMNKTTFVGSVFDMLGSGIGIVLIIPTTSYVTSWFLFQTRKKSKKPLTNTVNEVYNEIDYNGQ